MPKILPRTCQQLREQLPEYAEGTLHGAPATAVARHLVTCPRCTQEVADLRAVLGVLHVLPAEDLPAGLVAGITEAVRRRAPTRGPAPSWSRLALPATVATGVLAVLLTLHTLDQNGDRLRGNGLSRAPIAEAPMAPSWVHAEASGARGVAPRAGAPARTPAAAKLGEPESPSSPATKPATVPTAPALKLGPASGHARFAPAPAPRPQVKELSPGEPSGRGAAVSSAPLAALPAPAATAKLARGPVALPLADDQFARADRGPASEGRETLTRPPDGAAVAQDQVARVEPGDTAPVGTSKPEVRAKLDHGAERAELPMEASRGGGSGGGGGRAGGGRGSFGRPRRAPGPESRPAFPYLGRRGQRPGPHGPSRPGAGLGNAHAGRAPSGPAKLQRRVAKGQPAAGPPHIALTRLGRELAVVLQVSAAEEGGRLSVKVAGREAAGDAGQVVLLGESAAAQAQALPVTITSPQGMRSFTLYAPSFSHLGQPQEGGALRRYREVPLNTVLSDVSRRAGLVLLVEGPTDRKVNGDLVLDSPQAAVETLAKYAGYTVRTHDAIVYTLALPEEGN